MTLTIKEYVDDAGLTHVDVQQTATGGLKGTAENRTLDDTYREHSDWLFGKVKGRSRWAGSAGSGVEELPDDAFLRSNWEDGTEEWVYGYVQSLDSTWTASQAWGFKVVDGERRHARNVIVEKGKERVEIKMFYDYVPE